jgi:hypothetical protein
MADQNPCLQRSTASCQWLTGTDVGRNSRTVSNQFVFARMPPERWVSFSSLARLLAANFLMAFAKRRVVGGSRTFHASPPVQPLKVFDMPTSEDFKTELYCMMSEALFEGKTTAEINAGDLHSRVGGYPGPNHRMPMCCVVMLAAFAPETGE